MRVNDDFSEQWNVADETKDADSVLTFWKECLEIRKQYDVLVSPSSFQSVPALH